MCSRVQPQITDLEHGRPLRGCPAGESAQPREQLLEREGLREVVVRARIKAADPVVDRVTRREHQHRGPDSALAHPAASLEAVHSRQHHVEDDHVVVDRLDHPERLLSAVGQIRRVALLVQATAEELAQLPLVLDYENPHRVAIVAPRVRAG